MADQNDQDEKKIDDLYIERNKLSPDALKKEKIPQNYSCGNGHALKNVRFRVDEINKYRCCRQMGGCKDDKYIVRGKNAVGCNQCKYFICRNCWDKL